MYLKYAWAIIHVYTYANTGAIIEGPSNVTYLPGLTPLPIKLTCNVTGVVAWRVNDTTYTLTDLTNGVLLGHNRTGTNILVNSPVNDTKYICLSQTNNFVISSDQAYIIIPGEFDIQYYVCSYLLIWAISWGESFNNFDPKVNYTVLS